ncbi:MAG: hypothetical protein M3069_30075 [Chloroflexota bacterium]|nr:hypothetical protein [Chloroflexota bacterium]
MSRGLVVFALVTCVLSAAAACGAPVADVANPNSPQAQATFVRRTEIAEVQRQIANNPTPTSTAEPTPAAPPTCQAKGAIWWYEARGHVGESRTVQGTIVGTRPAAGGLALLEVGQRYPDPTGLAVLLPATGGQTLDGKTVCVAGQITSVEGRPTIQLQSPSTIQVVN